MATPLACVGRILIKPRGIWLHHFAVINKEKAELVCRHRDRKCFGFIERGAQALGDRQGIDRRNASDLLPGEGQMNQVSPHLLNQAFRREAG